MDFPAWIRKWVQADNFYIGDDSPYFPHVGALAELAAVQHEALWMDGHSVDPDEVFHASCGACKALEAAKDFQERYS